MSQSLCDPLDSVRAKIAEAGATPAMPESAQAHLQSALEVLAGLKASKESIALPPLPLPKAKKPYPDFPLSVASNGQWAKKVKGRRYYFGSTRSDPAGERAIKDWNERRDGIFAGTDSLRVAPQVRLTLGTLIDRYLAARKDDLLANRLSPESFRDYLHELTLLKKGRESVNPATLRPDHWAAYVKRHLIGKRKLGRQAARRALNLIKHCFNYAHGEDWIPKPHFGNAFKAYAVDGDRIAAVRAGTAPRSETILTPADVTKLLAEANPQFQAMILLGLNAGLGPSDVARLRWGDIDFENGRLSGYRGKTGIKREAYLWKKTRAALLKIRSLKHNRRAWKKDGAKALVFLTRSNLPFIRRCSVIEAGIVKKIKIDNAITITFRKLAIRAGVKCSFYNLRHTYRTLADNGRDANAVLRSMGHALRGMDRVYVNGPLAIERLKRVAVAVSRQLRPSERQR